MPTLPNRLLRQSRPSSSSDNPYKDDQVEDYYERSSDESSFGTDRGPKYSHLPLFTQYPVQRSGSSARNSKSHTRSRSHPFPSLFGTSRKRGDSLSSKARDTEVFIDGDDDDDDDDDDYAPQLDGSSSPGRRKIMSMDHRRIEERDIETENCMTCDSKVKRPKGLKTFCCGTCMMVNDLERWDRQSFCRGRYEEPAAKERVTSRSHTIRKRKSFKATRCCIRILTRSIAALLSPSRLQELIERCTIDYLNYRLGITKPEFDDQARIDKQINIGPHHELLDGRDGRHDAHTVLKQTIIHASPPDQASDQVPTDDIQLHPSRKPSSNESGPVVERSEEDQKSCQGNARSTNFTASPVRQPPLPSIQREVRPPPMRVGSSSDKHAHMNKAQTSHILVAEDPIDRSNYEIAKKCFSPLEDHINSSYRNAECLNASFIAGRISYAGRARSEGFVSSPRKTRPAAPMPTASEGFSELDPKTLLLADVAENGSWWTGRPQRLQQSPERASETKCVLESAQSYIINYRSARIGWYDVSRWYDMVCNVDRSLQTVWEKFLEGTTAQKLERSVQKSEKWNQVEPELKRIRHHFRRVLLKATEDLLKRPGYPLRDPDNTRFLLILLANPLLHASDLSIAVPAPGKASQVVGRQDANLGPYTGQPRGSERVVPPPLMKARRNSVHAFEIVKRILGLLSNLPARCHNHLVSWFIRYDEERLQSTVDLVGRFVTYRLSRQSGKKPPIEVDPTAHLIPELSGSTTNNTAQLHAALELARTSSQKRENKDGVPQIAMYSEDWQLVAAAKVMALLFATNNIYYLKRPSDLMKGISGTNSETHERAPTVQEQQRQRQRKRGHIAHGQLLPTSHFYNSLLDYIDLITDFETWQSKQAKFTFTQFHFFIPIGAKTKIMEYDARRQMDSKARNAFFNNIFRNRNIEQFFQLKVRRNCLIEDSLGRISEAVGAGQGEVKKGLRVQFAGEEGVDAGGLRKEWFQLLVRELIDPNNGM